MKTNYLLSGCLPLLLSATMHQQPDFAQLSALSGTWKSEGGKRVLYENWVVVKTGEMHGKSFRLQGSDTVILEDVKLAQEKDGIFYIPTVKNQNGSLPVPFKLVQSAGKQFIFENAAHDFHR